MSSAEDLAAGLYRAPDNAGPRTRALYEYQDACVVLRCIPNLLPGGHVEAVVVEWSTDYILLGRDGRRELVSVKHRDPGQHDWTAGRLKAENVFRDLHAVWRAMGETGDYVFESNAGFEPALRPYMGNPGERAVPDREAAGKLASYLQADLDEVLRFLPHFFLRRDPLPGRFHIGAVAAQDLAVVMEHLGLDPSQAGNCLVALTARTAEVSTQRPPEPSHRVERLTGFMREIEDHALLTASGSLLTMDELRDIVVTASRGSRRGHGQVAVIADDPLFVGRNSELAQIAGLLHPGSEDVVRPVALTGMPGIGKTALAARFAASYATRLRAYVLSADTRTALVAGIHSLNPPVIGTPLSGAQVIGLEPPPSPPSLPDDPALLVIIDGLTDPAAVDGLVARQSRTRVLITATCRHVDDAFTHISLHGLTSREGAAYLRQVLPDADTGELEEMYRAFSGHPLGLAQGANYCRNEGLSPREYLARLSLHPAQMLQLGRSPGHPLALGRAIETAFTAASGQDRTATDLAAIMACLAPEPVPSWLFSQAPLVLQRDDGAATAHVSFSRAEEEIFGRAAALIDLPTLDRAVAAMHRYGLITRARESCQWPSCGPRWWPVKSPHPSG